MRFGVLNSEASGDCSKYGKMISDSSDYRT